MARLKAACVQFTAGPDLQTNLKTVESFIRQAAAQGATLIATPENTDMILTPAARKIEIAQTQEDHEGVAFLAALAKELKISLIIGSMSVKLANGKLANRSFLFNDKGELAAQYDKIHLFDVDLPTGERHRESETIQPGDMAVVVGNIGLSVCYDLRFAYLYRTLAQRGAEIIAIPAAFTVPTGKAHWEILLRARAIETGSFILAPAQVGEHDGGRKTWGHSLIIGPWGDILADAGEKPGIIVAEIDTQDTARARNAIPALKHDRVFT